MAAPGRGKWATTVTGSTGFSGLCFATALGAIAAKSKRSASPHSTNLLVLILFIIRLSQSAFTGNNERFDLLFLLDNAILEPRKN